MICKRYFIRQHRICIALCCVATRAKSACS